LTEPTTRRYHLARVDRAVHVHIVVVKGAEEIGLQAQRALVRPVLDVLLDIAHRPGENSPTPT